MGNMIKYEEVHLVNSSDIDINEEGAFTIEEWATNICPETESSKIPFKENTYPDLQSVLNELHRRGLMPEGLYFISK